MQTCETFSLHGLISKVFIMRCTYLIVNMPKVSGKKKQCFILFLHEERVFYFISSQGHFKRPPYPFFPSHLFLFGPFNASLVKPRTSIIFAAWALEVVWVMFFAWYCPHTHFPTVTFEMFYSLFGTANSHKIFDSVDSNFQCMIMR